MRTKDFILLGAGYAAGRMSKKMQAGPIGAIKGSWKAYISPFLEKTDKQFKNLFKEYNKELKEMRINPEKDVSLANKLWNAKYKKRFDLLENSHDQEYKKLWLKFHKK